MNVDTISYNKIAIRLSIEELEFFQKILVEVQQSIQDSFTTRVGVSPRQAQGFFESIIQEIKQSDKTSLTVILLYQEMFLFQNLLNEVFNAILINNFEIKLGKSEKEIKDILQWFCTATNEMQSLQKARQASYIKSLSKLPKQKDVNQCCLEGDGYSIKLYIRKLLSFKNTVNIFIVLTIDATQSGEFSIKSVSKPIQIEELYDFIKGFKRYLEMTDSQLEALEIPFKIFKGSIFQVHTLERGITLKTEKYTLIDFVVYLPNSRASIMKPLLGVRGAVTFKKISNFILSLQQILDEE